MSCLKQLILITVFGLLTANKASCQDHKQYHIPRASGYVNDFERLFSPKQEKELDSAIVAFERRTTAQIAILTIDTSMVARNDFDDYVLQIANSWGVGQKGKDNGVVIGISRGYRKMRMTVGRGIESKLSDNDTKTIIDTAFIPYYKKDLYFEGTMNGLRAIMKKLKP